jgi:WhiB family redox-sensing transcriptional regulator
MATLGLHVVGGNRPAALDAASGGAEWTTRAVCATADPDLLFVTGAAQREAAKMCRGCPVKLECLADALDNKVEFGVWGGLTERQRRALLKRNPEVTSWHDVLLEAREDATRSVAG